MLTLVTMPTRHPLRLARSAMLVSTVVVSAAMPMRWLAVFVPQASAVPPAAESVTELVAECVVTIVATGNWVKHRLCVPMMPSFSARNISVPSTCAIPMPSPMKRNTYFRFCAAACTVHSAMASSRMR